MKLVVYLLLILSVACGKKSSSTAKKPVKLDPIDIEYIMENQEFECAPLNNEACPEGLARLFIINREDLNNSSQCSGFLIAPDRVITNHHCLSDDIECSDTHISIYTGTGFEAAKCNRVVKAVDDGRPLIMKAVDFSIIELDKPVNGVKPFEVAPSNVEVGDIVHAWVVDHQNALQARITELACIVRNDTGSLEMDHCAAIHGNSGSPILNSRNEIIGVLWGSEVPDSTGIDETTSLYVRRDLDFGARATLSKHFMPYVE